MLVDPGGWDPLDLASLPLFGLAEEDPSNEVGSECCVGYTRPILQSGIHPRKPFKGNAPDLSPVSE